MTRSTSNTVSTRNQIKSGSHRGARNCWLTNNYAKHRCDRPRREIRRLNLPPERRCFVRGSNSLALVAGVFAAGTLVGLIVSQSGSVAHAQRKASAAADAPSPVGARADRDVYYPGSEALAPDEMVTTRMGPCWRRQRDARKAARAPWRTVTPGPPPPDASGRESTFPRCSGCRSSNSRIPLRVMLWPGLRISFDGWAAN